MNARGAGEVGIVSAEVGQSLFPSQDFNDYYPVDDGDANTGELYRALIDAINAELSADSEVYLAGVFWLQGEEDSTSQTYGPDYFVNLNALYQNLTGIFGTGFDFVVSALSTYIDAAGIQPEWDTVRQAQEDLAAAENHVYLIDPDDLIDVEGYTAAEVFDDDVHYTQIAYQWLADRFFDLFPVAEIGVPEAVDDGAATDEDLALTGNVLADNGAGADTAPGGGALTVNTTPVSGVANGTLVLSANGEFSYTPNANFNGTDSFVYEVSDSDGDTATATVTIAVAPVNDAPEAGNDSGIKTPHDTPIDIAAATLLANDDDGDPDLAQTLTITAVGGAVNGTVALAAGTVTFTPTPGYWGPASFTYDVSDGAGGTDTATVTLNIVVNAPPIAGDDTYAVNENATVSGNVFDNDSDLDADGLTATLLSGPAEGVFVFEANGAFTYAADAELFDLAAPGTVIEQTFSYQVSDGYGGVDQATATLFVTILDDGETLVARGSRPSPVTGTDGEDRILGGRGNDLLYGLDGADTMLGGNRDDRIYGGDSADFLSGDAGSDRIFGENGTDIIAGGAGNDKVNGGAGDDRLGGDTGRDSLSGSTGDDRLAGDGGRDVLSGGSGDDQLYGGAGGDVLRGGSGDDGLFGGNGDDRLIGGSGNDLVKGGDGADTLKGDDGDDLLNGGNDNDRLVGGAGADRFVFGAGNGTDRVVDFTDGEDMLVLNAIAFEDVAIAQVGADTTITAGGEILAILLGVDAALVTVDDFIV